MDLQKLKNKIDKISPSDIAMLKKLILGASEVIILGNGGSNSVASHTAQDYTKQLSARAFTFSDPSRLTCYINDYGMEKAYVQFMTEFVSSNSLVILISSSGESDNILNCAEYCCINDINYIVLSGFDAKNQLKNDYGPMACLNFWVDSSDYGIVEIIHQIILHAVL
jgi:D-sedoheptulose 7-phosphate isomerase